MARVFISYRREEPSLTVARALYRELTERDHDVFLDEEGIRPGVLWEREIAKNIERAPYFVVLLSAAYVERRSIIDDELLVAARLRERDPTRQILTINLAYAGDPPPDVRNVLPPEVQHLRWRSHADTDKVARRLTQELPASELLIKGLRSMTSLDTPRFAALGRAGDVDRSRITIKHPERSFVGGEFVTETEFELVSDEGALYEVRLPAGALGPGTVEPAPVGNKDADYSSWSPSALVQVFTRASSEGPSIDEWLRSHPSPTPMRFVNAGHVLLRTDAALTAIGHTVKIWRDGPVVGRGWTPELKVRTWHAAAAGSPIFAGDDQKKVVVAEWNDQGGKTTTRPLPELGWVRGVAFDPDDRGLIECHSDGTILHWSWRDPNAKVRVVARLAELRSCKRSHDGRRLVVKLSTGGMQILDANTGAVIASIDRAGYFTDVHPAPDGDHAVVTYGGFAEWGDLQTLAGGRGRLLDASCARAVDISPDGQWIAIGSQANMSCAARQAKKPPAGMVEPMVQIWRTTGGGAIALTGPTVAVTRVAFSPDSLRLAAVSGDGFVRIWTVGRAQPDLAFLACCNLASSPWSRDGSQLLVFGANEVEVWPTTSPGDSMIIQHAGVEFAAFLPGDRSVVSRSSSSIRVDAIDWATLRTKLRAHTSACLSPYDRQRYLGESNAIATERATACNRQYHR